MEKEKFVSGRSPVGSVLIGIITFAILYSLGLFAIGIVLLVACAVAVVAYFKPFYSPFLIIAFLAIPVYHLLPSNSSLEVVPMTILLLAFCVIVTVCFVDWFGALVGLWLGLSLYSGIGVIVAIPAIALLSAWAGMKKAVVCSTVLAVFGFLLLNTSLFGLAIPQQSLQYGTLFPNLSTISAIPLASYVLPYLFGSNWQQGFTSSVAETLLNNSPMYFILVSLILIPVSGYLGSFIKRRINSLALAALAAALIGTLLASMLYGVVGLIATSCVALFLCWLACAISIPLLSSPPGLSVDGILGVDRNRPTTEKRRGNDGVGGVIISYNPSGAFRGGNYWGRAKGLDGVKKELLSSVFSVSLQGQAAAGGHSKSCKGILLLGPAGTGKVMLMRGLSSKLAMTYVEVVPEVLLKEWQGECQQKIRGALQAAVHGAPSIFVVDGIDKILNVRQQPDAGADSAAGVMNELLKGFDTISNSGAEVVLVVTASSCAFERSLLPPIFDGMICVTPPDEHAREDIFRLCLGDFASDVDSGRLAKLSEGLTGGDIVALIDNVKSAAFFNKILSSREQKIDQGVLENAVRVAKPTVSQETVDDMEKFRVQFLKERKIVKGFDPARYVTFGDIGGLDEVKDSLSDALVINFGDSDLVKMLRIKTPKIMLLYGPRGNGKTLLAEAVSSEAPVNFFAVDYGVMVAGGSTSDAVAKVKETFDLARKCLPAIVFLDDVEMLAPRSAPARDNLASQLLAELDHTKEISGLMVLAAGSSPDDIEASFLSRIEKQLLVPMPDEYARADIFSVCLKKVKSKEISCQELAKMTEGLSGLNIRELVEGTYRIITEGTGTAKRDWLTMDDFRAAIEIKKSKKDLATPVAQPFQLGF